MTTKGLSNRYGPRGPYTADEYMRTIGFSCPESWAEKIQNEAWEHNRTVSSLMREILQPWIEGRQKCRVS